MKALLIAFAMLLGTVAHAQESTLPKNIEQAFKTKYPKYEVIDAYEENNQWVIIFEVTGEDQTGESFYSTSGQWVKTHLYGDETMLPENLKKSLSSKYKDFYYGDIKTTEDSTGSYLEITIETDDSTYYIKADKTGKVLTEKKL